MSDKNFQLAVLISDCVENGEGNVVTLSEHYSH